VDAPELQEITELDEIRPDDEPERDEPEEEEPEEEEPEEEEPERDENGRYTAAAKKKGPRSR
jgi:hypothetical protein